MKTITRDRIECPRCGSSVYTCPAKTEDGLIIKKCRECGTSYTAKTQYILEEIGAPFDLDKYLNGEQYMHFEGEYDTYNERINYANALKNAGHNVSDDFINMCDGENDFVYSSLSEPSRLLYSGDDTYRQKVLYAPEILKQIKPLWSGENFANGNIAVEFDYNDSQEFDMGVFIGWLKTHTNIRFRANNEEITVVPSHLIRAVEDYSAYVEGNELYWVKSPAAAVKHSIKFTPEMLEW